jgi:hypothetical protein
VHQECERGAVDERNSWDLRSSTPIRTLIGQAYPEKWHELYHRP